MKNNEIKKIYNLYLQGNIPEEYCLKGDLLYRIFDGNMLLGFVFARSGFNKNGFYLHKFVQPLYILDEDINLTFGDRIIFNNDDFWEIDLEKDNSKLFIILANEINLNIKSFLNKVNTPELFYNYYKKKSKTLRWMEAVVLSSCHYLSDKRFELMDKYISVLEKEDMSINWRRILLDQARLLQSNISNEEELKNILLSWQTETKVNLKL